ncbi:hypothetical protein AX14_012974 [Amanita brunnescens Koide BX004]|nr:hypothetical protein AX14_012974 [Amanita brunnescens Koide BX004]
MSFPYPQLVGRVYFHSAFASDSEIEVLSNIDDLAPTEGISWVPSEHEDDNVKKAKKGKARAQVPPSSPRLQQPVAAQSSSGSRATKDRSLSKSSKNVVMSPETPLTSTSKFVKPVVVSDSELEVLSNIDDLPPNEGIPWVPSEHEDDNAAKKAKKGKVRAQPPASSPPLQQPIAAQSSVASRARKDHSIGSASSRARAPTCSQLLYPSFADFTMPPADSDYNEQMSDFDSVDTEVMPLNSQDPKLRRDYVGLPQLTYAELTPFGHISSHSQMHYTENYTPAWAALHGDALTRRRFRSAIHFVHHLPFVNPARASPSIVNREGGRVLVANSQQHRQTAVFLTTGIVSLCELITPGWQNSQQVRRISLCPFTIEYQRTIAYIGKVLGIKSFVGALSDGNIVFSMRPEGTGGPGTPSSAGPATPTQRGRRPIMFKNSNSSASYPTSLGFNDHVPIYDARNVSDFLFGPTNMDHLRVLPLYADGAEDLPPEMLTVVGYTLNTFI